MSDSSSSFSTSSSSGAAPAFGFGNFVPGFDFLQTLVQSASQQAKAGGAMPAGLPDWSKWVAPTLQPDEIEKRIGELKTVQFWLEQNARALAATIQALEVQKMTLATLREMNVQMEDMAGRFGFGAATAAEAPASAPPSATAAAAAASGAAQAAAEGFASAWRNAFAGVSAGADADGNADGDANSGADARDGAQDAARRRASPGGTGAAAATPPDSEADTGQQNPRSGTAPGPYDDMFTARPESAAPPSAAPAVNQETETETDIEAESESEAEGRDESPAAASQPHRVDEVIAETHPDAAQPDRTAAQKSGQTQQASGTPAADPQAASHAATQQAMQWWTALTGQFQQIAATALQDAARQARSATGVQVTDAALRAFDSAGRMASDMIASPRVAPESRAGSAYGESAGATKHSKSGKKSASSKGARPAAGASRPRGASPDAAPKAKPGAAKQAKTATLPAARSQADTKAKEKAKTKTKPRAKAASAGKPAAKRSGSAAGSGSGLASAAGSIGASRKSGPAAVPAPGRRPAASPGAAPGVVWKSPTRKSAAASAAAAKKKRPQR